MTQAPSKWAERKDKLFITVDASNATDVKVDFEPSRISVSGSGITARSSEAHAFKVEFNLNGEVVPEKSTFKVLGQSIQVCAVKKSSGYWNKLVVEPAKVTKGWLSADWNLWKDEDDEAKPENVDFGGYGDMANMMNFGGGAGAPEGDSDDEEEEPPAADLKDLEA